MTGHVYSRWIVSLMSCPFEHQKLEKTGQLITGEEELNPKVQLCLQKAEKEETEYMALDLQIIISS
jgi:hypothetical protein